LVRLIVDRQLQTNSVKELNSAKDLKNKIARALKNLIQRKISAIDDNGALFSL